MTDVMEITISGIKCDHCDHCDYTDDAAKFEDYEQYVNKPCPVCGENLLTQSDMDATVEMMGRMEMINAIMENITPEELQMINDTITPEIKADMEVELDMQAGAIDEACSHEGMVKMEFKMDGTGKIKVGEITPIEKEET